MILVSFNNFKCFRKQRNVRFDIRFCPLAENPLLTVNPSCYLAFFELLNVRISQAGETTKKKSVANLCETITRKFFICHQVQLSSGKNRFVNLFKLALE